MVQLSTGGYVRHRDRMVAQSVFDDIANTLIACRWMTGTTTRLVIDPFDTEAGWQILTVAEDDLLPLLGKRRADDPTTEGPTAEVVLIDFFPEVGAENDEEEGRSRKTELNTFAVDQGVTDDASYIEMGSNMMEQPYTFTMAFYAESDAVALAVMNDLRDRYQGRIVTDDHVDLFNYNKPGFNNTSPPVCRMDVERFTFERDEADRATPVDVFLYFAQLELTDYVDSKEPIAPLVIGQAGGIQVGHGPPSGPPSDGSTGYLDLDTGILYEWTP